MVPLDPPELDVVPDDPPEDPPEDEVAPLEEVVPLDEAAPLDEVPLVPDVLSSLQPVTYASKTTVDTASVAHAVTRKLMGDLSFLTIR